MLLLRELKDVETKLKELDQFEPVSQEEENRLMKLKFSKILLSEKIKLLGWVLDGR